MFSIRSFVVGSAALLWVAGVEAASPKSPSYSGFAPEAEAGVEVVFTRHEIKVIRAYYRTHSDNASRYDRPVSKKNGKGLPPGIAKNLARGKPLPPGIAKKALPSDLEYRLPPVAEGYERIIVDGKILLVELATQIVRDVLTEAILG